MTTICLTFQIHQPQTLKPYRFFDLGIDHFYCDELSLKNKLQEEVAPGFLNMNQILLELIALYPEMLKINFSITGITLAYFAQYCPELLKSFKQLEETGNVVFLGGTYTHSIASLISESALKKQVSKSTEIHQKLLAVTPKSFLNTASMYSDKLGNWIRDLGFKSVLTEAEPSTLGWNSSDTSFVHPTIKDLSIVLRNSAVSEHVASRLTDESWQSHKPTEIELVNWVEEAKQEGSCTQLLLPYSSLCGTFQKQKANFITELMQLISGMNISFVNHGDGIENSTNKKSLEVPVTIANLGEQKSAQMLFDSPLVKNVMDQLFILEDKINQITDEAIRKDFEELQALEHFIWMLPEQLRLQYSATLPSPYENEYKAYINYMNVLNDLTLRVDALLPQTETVHAVRLLDEAKLRQKDQEIKGYKSQLKKIKKALKALNSEVNKQK